ncbi:MAG: hypothetical protein LBT08_08225, partial [Synergistaceae bacterium]|nr:hypothetical protein [Synergistaceae bacterium]
GPRTGKRIWNKKNASDSDAADLRVKIPVRDVMTARLRQKSASSKGAAIQRIDFLKIYRLVSDVCCEL